MMQSMKTDQLREPAPIFAQMVSLAIGSLKKRLQRYYQTVYPHLGETIRLVIDEEEAKAWEISFFPHLILPDLVDTRIGKLGGLQQDEAHYARAALSRINVRKMQTRKQKDIDEQKV
jgi:hypothetical protein